MNTTQPTSHETRGAPSPGKVPIFYTETGVRVCEYVTATAVHGPGRHAIRVREVVAPFGTNRAGAPSTVVTEAAPAPGSHAHVPAEPTENRTTNAFGRSLAESVTHNVFGREPDEPTNAFDRPLDETRANAFGRTQPKTR